MTSKYVLHLQSNTVAHSLNHSSYGNVTIPSICTAGDFYVAVANIKPLPMERDIRFPFHCCWATKSFVLVSTLQT